MRATHDFLSPEHFDYFHERVASDYFPSVDLYGAFLAPGAGTAKCTGFIGLGKNPEDGAAHIEMLFIDPAWHRRGIGKRLVDYAKAMSPKVFLKVNEQNGSALDFYLRQDFEIIGRSNLDPGGKPYPLLSMCHIDQKTLPNE